jgi:hypothetical protein
VWSYFLVRRQAVLERIHLRHPVTRRRTLLLWYQALDICAEPKRSFLRKTYRNALLKNLMMFPFPVFGFVSRPNLAGPSTKVSALAVPILPRDATAQSAPYPLSEDFDAIPTPQTATLHIPGNLLPICYTRCGGKVTNENPSSRFSIGTFSTVVCERCCIPQTRVTGQMFASGCGVHTMVQ